MSDQADNLRQLIYAVPPPVHAAADGPPLVVVAGSRPGVGTTTMAVNLAAALADTGLRIVLADGAQRIDDIFRAAGTDAASAASAARTAAAPTLVPGPAGFLLLAAAAPDEQLHVQARHAAHRLLAELRMLSRDIDLVLVDAGSGAAPATRRLWRNARLVLAVTSVDDAAVIDSYAMLKQANIDALDAEIRVLVNQCDAPARAEDVYRRLSNASLRFLGQAVQAAPFVPSHPPAHNGPGIARPRVWEAPDSPFGHAVLWLARAVMDMLACLSCLPLAA
jgi:flagellar biosynthesis protein FlhG